MQKEYQFYTHGVFSQIMVNNVYNKHLKRRHVGLFAVNLKTAIRDSSKPSHLHPNHRLSTPFTRPFHTGRAAKNNQSMPSRYIPEIYQQPSRSRLPEMFTSYGNAAKNSHVNTCHHHY